ncbi:MAG: hypothetical protein ACE5FH_12135 [Candidatus Zixiibacteriota bacterium]
MNTFKKNAYLGCLLLALLLLVGSAFAAPRLTLGESAFNFGFVPQNAKISHDFWLKSTGDDTLKILKVVPG